MSERRDVRIEVPVLARVEGEGALELELRQGAIHSLNLRIYEPPRLFEKFLEGRAWHEVPDMVARICGICPVAYQMSAVQALESIFAIEPGPWVRTLRRVMYCGEWIQSHALHIHLLAAPDFLGFNSAVAMAEQYPDEVRRGMQLQSLGNRLIALLGGRSVHPVGVCVGGFHHAPNVAEVQALLPDLTNGIAQAEALVRWCATLPLPDDEQDFVSVALRHDSEYPMIGHRLISSTGLDIAIAEFEQHFTEHQSPHSTALHATLEGKPYLVGPLARLNLNADRLPAPTRALLDALPVRFPSRNMFHSALARALEIHAALVEATALLQNYRVDTPALEVTPRAGTGYGCSEAPRGILWHRYDVNDAGNVSRAVIVPPTSQNQGRIEEDLRCSLESYGLEHSDDELRLRGEMVIRNYDPCISCSTHFLRMQVRRT
ncbi:MAG: nickel-dependent hydrogenase large subunit [Gammaproteobacteria bacterium]